ncbi:hypothetical protein BJX65DRAFT_22262 [Aspergillus insuetus]
MHRWLRARGLLPHEKATREELLEPNCVDSKVVASCAWCFFSLVVIFLSLRHFSSMCVM